MTILAILIIFAVYLLVNGLWTMYSAGAYKKAYEKFKQGDESYLDFLVREVSSPKYVIAQKLHPPKHPLCVLIENLIISKAGICFPL